MNAIARTTYCLSCFDTGFRVLSYCWCRAGRARAAHNDWHATPEKDRIVVIREGETDDAD